MATETKLRQLADKGCPVYYFYSSERYLVRQAVTAITRILTADSDEDATILDGAAPEIEQLIMAAGTISFFGTRRVVVLPEIDPAAYSDKDLEELSSTLSSLENAVVVLGSVFELERSKLKTGKRAQKLIAQCKALGYTEELAKPKPFELKMMMIDRAKEQKTTLPDGAAAALLERCTADIPVYAAELEVLTQLTGFHLTRGMLCAMRRPKLPSVEDVCRNARRVVVLENVMNPTNIGAIFRSAAALGMDAVLLTTAGSDPLYRRASRVSMGNVFLIPWTYLPESGDWTQLLRDLGFRTVAMALRNDSVRLDDPRLAAEEKLAIVMGTEGDGLASSTIASCDYTVRIPMYHGVDSLNVAAASAVAFYELGLPPLNEKED